MIEVFLTFALSLPRIHQVHVERAPEAIDAAVAVVNTQGCFPFSGGASDEVKCEKSVKALLVLTLFESGWKANPPSIPGADNDKGAACGAGQVHVPNLMFGSCEEARSSLFHGMREAHAFLKKLSLQCGSVERGWGAYATGKCGGAPKSTAWKCALIGGC